MAAAAQSSETYPVSPALRQFIEECGDDEVVIYHGFGGEPSLIYSVDKILEILVADGLTYDEAREHFDFNVAGGYVGERTPIFVHHAFQHPT